MHEFIVITDLDNCINNLNEKMFEMYNARYGTNYTCEDMKTYDFEDCFSLEETERLMNLFLEEELWNSLTPVANAQWALKSLVNSGYKVYVATATHYINFAWKIEWMKKYFPFIDEKNIIRIHDKSLLKCDVLIEDCYENLIDSMSERVLINKPWNGYLENRDYVYGVNRANNWEEVVRFVNKIYKDEMEW